MSQLINIYIKDEVLQILAKTITMKREKGLSITISVNDKPDKYGQNVWAFVSQSKEDREAKKTKYTVGNGSTFWSSNGEFIPKKEDKKAAVTAANQFDKGSCDAPTAVEDLPF
jgi:hypothetical protein